MIKVSWVTLNSWQPTWLIPFWLNPKVSFEGVTCTAVFPKVLRMTGSMVHALPGALICFKFFSSGLQGSGHPEKGHIYSFWPAVWSRPGSLFYILQLVIKVLANAWQTAKQQILAIIIMATRFFCLFFRQGLTMLSWLAWNKIYKTGWPGIHRDLPALASMSNSLFLDFVCMCLHNVFTYGSGDQPQDVIRAI